jgi:hypothetical protein
MRAHKGATVLVICGAIAFGLASRARADSVAIDFESYSLGSIDGQDGWSATGPYDYGVVDPNTFGTFPGFGTRSFRISNAVTSGSFGDWAFSKSLADEAGESNADDGGLSGGVRQGHFEVSFDIAAADPNEQTGLQISVSPDRGDGARMSFLRFSDQPGGLMVEFDDYHDNAPFGSSSNLAAGCGAEDDFVLTTVASGLDRSVPHRIRLAMDFLEGPRNDVVKVYVDGALVHTGTSWEDFFRYCEATDTSRTVDSLLLQARTSGGTAPGTLGFGFLVDNIDLESGPCPSTPETGCQPPPARGAKLLLKTGRLAWRWTSSGTVDPNDFGNPLATTSYRMCLYDATGVLLHAEAPADGMCGTKPCWRTLGVVGFKFNDKVGTPGQLGKLTLRSGGPGRGRIQANPPRRGGLVAIPPLPLMPPVRVQLHQSDSGACWDATYSSPSKNDASRFKAKSD